MQQDASNPTGIVEESKEEMSGTQMMVVEETKQDQGLMMFQGAANNG